MTACSHIVQIASYNTWMNAKLYAVAGTLSPSELAADRKAFFKSILGTLNHIVVGDTIWLKRFATHPSEHAALAPFRELSAPSSLDELLFPNVGELFKHRKTLDGVIQRWAAELKEQDLQHVLSYKNMKGVPQQKNFGSLVMHFFNHQTHHRGQVTTLLCQAGQDVGVTDLLAVIPDEANV